MANPVITKRVLSDSMKKLMSQYPLSKISISDIVADSGLNRNSFYYHFKDKYDLVNWIFYTDFISEFSNHLNDNGWEFFLNIYTFFYNNKTFYTNALSVTGQNSFADYFTDIMKQLIMPQIQEIFPDAENHEIYSKLFIHSLLTNITHWLLDESKIPPEKMAELTKSFLIGISNNVSDLFIAEL